MKNREKIQFRDFSKSNIRVVQSSIAPPNSVKLALNLDSDQELGSMVSRLGTGLVGAQAVASASCLGLHYLRDSFGTTHKLFGVFSDGTNNDIYDMTDGSKSLEDDTTGLKTRFLTYLDSCLRLNGTDIPKAFQRTSTTASPATVTNTAYGDSESWTNPTNITSSNDVYATNTVAYSNSSDYLDITNFSFSVPTGAIISGITVEMERKCDTTSGRDELVQIIKGGTAQGDNYADRNNDWPTTDTYKTYGSRGSLWGLSLSAADVNASDFGVRIQTYGKASNRTYSIDHVQITVYYSAWLTTGGAFDLANMPNGTVVTEWKDRVYTAGISSSPCVLYYSGVADPTTRAVSWTTGNGQIEIEQEDGGGDITALEKVPGYLLIFKERSMKRWDGSSTYPEDLVNVGAPTQEAVCRGRGMVFIANQEGLWATNGGYPKRLSKPIQDLWDAIPAANIDDIATYCDENYVYVYVGDITLGDNSFTNVCFKYNIDSQTIDVYSYCDDFTVFTWYISSSEKVIVGGNKNGQAIQLNTGNTDYGSTLQPITYSLETQDLEFGARGKVKELSTMNVFTENCRTGKVMCRSNSNRDKDWNSIGNITSDVQDIDLKQKGNWFNLKITGVTSTGQVKILGFEFPEQSINITDNVNL